MARSLSMNVSKLPADLEQFNQSAEDLMPLIYDELRSLASGYLERQRKGHTLQPTALVHEAFLKVVNRRQGDWKDLQHFMAVASIAMRHVLVNYARERDRLRRGGDLQKIQFDETVAMFEDRALDLIALDEALVKLSEVEPRLSRVVELRFFGGLTIKETANLLGISTCTVDADWSMARAWLLREIKKD